MHTTYTNTSTQFILFVMAISIYRATMLYLLDPNMYVDEAYYWVWSQNFDWGYYSKPPMIAWFISIATSIFGDASLVIKSIPIVIYPLTATMIYLSAKTLFDEKTALYAGVLFFSLPAVSLSSFIISTDVVLLLFWSLTLYSFIQALKSNEMKYWILAGIFGGFGLLSKYNMILFVLSAFLYLLYSPTHRKILTNRSFYITLIIAALVFLPNLIWNYNNEFISFVHLKEISHVEQELFHFDKMLEFLGAQFGVFGPVSFGLLLYIFATSYSHRKDEKFMMLFLFAVVFLGVITLQAFLSRAFANWAAPTYVTASILVAYVFINKQKTKLLQWSIAINLILMVLMYHYEPMMNTLGVEISKKNDPYARIRGWKRFGEEVTNIYKDYPEHTLLAMERKEVSELIYYVKPHPFNTRIFNPGKKIKNYFHQNQDLNEHIGENFIFVSKSKSIESVSKYFKHSKFIKSIQIKIHKDYALNYHLYELTHFKGY